MTGSSASKPVHISSRTSVTSRSRWQPISSGRTGKRPARRPAWGEPAMPATPAAPSSTPIR
ncbi:hypothetical protein ABT025_09245 [Streptomyces sp. NPDC002809]|uniref:hypothetical protein n=1 Tax=Streptomyces sp. NPDC002809 TaxID=3154433 RepID=UPI00332AB5D6